MAKKKDTGVFNARPYMELAIEEMNKSIAEPRPDGKVPPKVGAILLFPDGKIERAHRGELRDGDHAEFTLLERKLGDKKLDECVLFTTLEPCVERTPPKIACCKRTSKARIKLVYVGIIDPDPTVSTKGIEHLKKHHVDVKMFDRDLQKQIETANKEFLKQASERKQKAEEEFVTPIEKPVANATFKKLSVEALQKFIDEAELPYKIDQPEFKDYLVDLGIMSYDEKDKTIKPNGYGVLLFGTEPRNLFKGAALKCTAKIGDYEFKPESFDMALVLVPDMVQDWLKKVLAQGKDTSAFKRTEKESFPISVIREAVINAIVHRDYSIDEAKNTISIDDDSIVVRSPGAPPSTISLEQLNTFEAPSYSRNPVISVVFNRMKYIEETGLGMKTFKSLNKEYKLPIPKYSYMDPFLTLTFPRTTAAVKEVIGKEKTNELSKEELNNFEIFREKRPVSKTEFVEFSGLSNRTAERYLKYWTDKGLLIKIGSGPGTKYQFVE